MERIWPTESSTASRAVLSTEHTVSRSACVLEASRSRAAEICMPVAKSCWMARSCRSRPIRARSSSSVAISSACWASASSKAMVACPATSSAISRSWAVKGAAPGERSSSMTPTPRPRWIMGA